MGVSDRDYFRTPRRRSPGWRWRVTESVSGGGIVGVVLSVLALAMGVIVIPLNFLASALDPSGGRWRQLTREPVNALKRLSAKMRR